MEASEMPLGAWHLGDGRTSFLLWAPRAGDVTLVLDGRRRVAMASLAGGYFHAEVENAPPGTRYRYVLDGAVEIADPASRSQPDGVTGDSAVTDPTFPWSDATTGEGRRVVGEAARCGDATSGDGTGWAGVELADLVVYELHVGAFTDAGSFTAVIEHLDELVDLGVTAIELMPVAEFPGGRNWGYDGVFPFAAQSTYGGPDDLRTLVDACHARGLGVLLDVVYNHLGPEGAPHDELPDYCTEHHRTPWGPSLNFDGPGSEAVRRHFIENALWWVDTCHLDGLRLDAVYAIRDDSQKHFLVELAETVQARSAELGRRILLVAESDRDEPWLVREPEAGGFGLDAVWSDDFHHALHAFMTGEQGGYYVDFGDIEHLAKAMREGQALTGQHSVCRGGPNGAPTGDVPCERFVVFAQNHDQAGNRMEGERLSALVSYEAVKVAAAVVLLSPYVPLLFMGEEYGEPAPFLYFVSHGEQETLDMVRAGRREDFASFEWAAEPPDPGDPKTFVRSKLDHSAKQREPHASLLAWYRRLLAIRREVGALATHSREALEVVAGDGCLAWRRWTPQGEEALVVANLSAQDATLEVELPGRSWRVILDSRDTSFGGPGIEPPERQMGGRVALSVPAESARVLSLEER
ncbi:MAG: malto-oligosyltrehalose trehalohydrolase [Nitriliruptorales bacterium]